MAKRKTKSTLESDTAYLLKIVMYAIIGSLWLKISYGENGQLPLPVGFIVGLLFAFHDHFRIDRKIEIAVLLVAMMLGFWAPIGIFVTL